MTPISLEEVSFSSGVSRWATSTVNRGVVALRMAAKPLATDCCPQTIRTKGSTLLSSPMPAKAAQIRLSCGNLSPSRRSTTNKVVAAIPTRSQTTVKGGRSRTATALKKKDPPHNAARASNMPHSRPFMGEAGDTSALMLQAPNDCSLDGAGEEAGALRRVLPNQQNAPSGGRFSIRSLGSCHSAHSQSCSG
jgi:hypothetical protein